MIDYGLILTRRYSGEWSLNGDDYKGLVWHGEGKPSKAELDALWPEVQAEAKAERVDRERRAAYATEADPLYFKEQRGEVPAGTWAAKVAEIRERIK